MAPRPDGAIEADDEMRVPMARPHPAPEGEQACRRFWMKTMMNTSTTIAAITAPVQPEELVKT